MFYKAILNAQVYYHWQLMLQGDLKVLRAVSRSRVHQTCSLGNSHMIGSQQRKCLFTPRGTDICAAS